MACRGVHFAITRGQLEKLVAASSDDEVIRVIQEGIESPWDTDWLHETDKAWDAIHRCLTDGTLDLDNGSFPLNAAVLGGRQLFDGDDYIISLVTPEQVPQVAQALRGIDEAALRRGYERIEQSDYDGDLDDDDFEYTWQWFQGLAPLFEKAAAADRAVLFTVDQ